MKIILICLIIVVSGKLPLSAQKIKILRDPFAPLLLFDKSDKKLAQTSVKKVSGRRAKIRLVGIVWDSHKPIAIFKQNGQAAVLKTGDKVNEAQIMEIGSKYVRVKYGAGKDQKIKTINVGSSELL
jgi:hypothetical protein